MNRNSHNDFFLLIHKNLTKMMKMICTDDEKERMKS